MKNKHEPSVIEVWINGIYLGKLTLKEDFDDRYDSIIHFGSLYGDIYWAEYIVNLILNEEWNFIADMNYDGTINVLDIIIVVEMILNN